ncbi:MAG: sulfotransferase [Pseudomonadota bacterium]
MAKRFKVFGIGLNKTGTTSLKLALQRLGYRHMRRTPRLLRLYEKGKLDALFAESAAWESFEDWPWPLIYRDAFARFGNRARYVLTRRRTAEVWVESLKRHALRTNPDKNPRRRIYGYDYPHGYEGAHVAFYERHLAEVRQHFADAGAAHLLLELCWEEGDGWAELCPFLGERAPREPFPHGNPGANEADLDPATLAENKRRIDAQLAQAQRP